MLTRLAGDGPHPLGRRGPAAIASTDLAFNSRSAEVVLTFHLWSGVTATYHVARSGTAITGIPA